MKRIKRMRPKKGATFLPERYYLSRSLQPPFSGNIHQYVIQSSGYLLSHRLHRLHRFSFVLRTPNLTTTYTTYTTSNGDTVAKGQVVLVVHVVVNSKFLSLILNLLSLILNYCRQDNPCPSVSIRCYIKPQKISRNRDKLCTFAGKNEDRKKNFQK